MSSGTTLYYPFIHPRESSHLKAALLYWDRVRRIVPQSLSEGAGAQDDDDDARMLSDCELLVSTSPEPYTESAGARFRRYLKSSPESARESVAKRYITMDRIHVDKAKFYNGGIKDEWRVDETGEWIWMPRMEASVYLFCLASEIAEKMATPIYTDSPRHAAAVQPLLFVPSSEDQVSTTLLRLGIKLPSPQQLQQRSMKEIMEFARRRQTEKVQFRTAIEGIVEKAKTCSDKNAMNDYLSTERVNIKSAIDNLNKSIDELRLGAINSFAKITVPAGLAAAIAHLPVSTLTSGVLAGFGLAIGAISCYAETRGKLRQARIASPYAYLTSVKTKFKTNPVRS